MNMSYKKYGRIVLNTK